MGKRKTYSRSFKQKAAPVVVDKGQVSAEVARELGISKNLLCKCKYLEDNAVAGSFFLKTIKAEPTVSVANLSNGKTFSPKQRQN